MARTTLNTIKHQCYELAGVTSTAQLKRKFRAWDLRKPAEWQQLLAVLMLAVAENDD